MPAILFEHDEDPADRICRLAGEIDDIEVFNDNVLVAVYERGDGKKEIKTAAGVIIPISSTDEDEHQSKVGLILKMGNSAFVDKKPIQTWFIEQDMSEGDWVWFRPYSGWRVTLVSKDPKTGQKRELLCRVLKDTAIDGRADTPDRIY